MTATISLPPDMPSRMRRLRRDEVGRPVPWFVPWVDGKPDFRLMDSERLVEAIRGQLCWVCGHRLSRIRGQIAPKGTFVAGPMCLVNRTSAEPPAHGDCAAWCARACPFLVRPGKTRREANLPERLSTAGMAIKRNPGVTALIESERWAIFRAPAVVSVGGEAESRDGLLFTMQQVSSVDWVCEGRRATAAEVLTSIETGIGLLVAMAETEEGALPDLARKLRGALSWVSTTSDQCSEYPTITATLVHG